MEVFPSVVNRVVDVGYFDALLFVILRTLLLSAESTLCGNKAGSRATPLFALAISAYFADL